MDERFKKILTEYVLNAGKDMLHAPAIGLPHPFVVPGAGYTHCLWDWDCFFSIMALLEILETKERRDELTGEEREAYILHAKGSVLNFLESQLEDGFIPIAIYPDNPSLDGRILHQNGCLTNMHKPVLAMNAALISGFIQDFNWLQTYFDKFELFYACYDKNYLNESGLYVWANDVMIGMDNDPATFGRPPKSSANIYLNSFMYRELKSMALICKGLGKANRETFYLNKAEQLQRIIVEECWDKRDGIYYSVDVDCKTRRPNPEVRGYHTGLGVTWKSLPLKVQTWCSFMPMWAGFASAEQSENMVLQHVKNTATFNSPFGVRTLSQDEKMYSVVATSNPSNWLGPIWIVANYIVYKGLKQYGFEEDAKEIGEKTLLLLGTDLEKNGALHEYYVPETGEGVIHKGFLNWNLLVLNMINEMDGITSVERFLP